MKKFLFILILSMLFCGCNESSQTNNKPIDTSMLNIKTLILNGVEFDFEELNKDRFLVLSHTREYILAIERGTISELPEVDAIAENEDLVDLVVEEIDENTTIITIYLIENSDVYCQYTIRMYYLSPGLDLSLDDS